MPFQRLSILGVGLLGGSIGMSLRTRSKHCHITGYGHNKESLVRAAEVGAVDRITSDPCEAVQGADLVIICTPVGTFSPILTQIASALGKGAVVTDVGSTKRSICRLAAQHLPKEVFFVGSHPMAGSERRGIEAARPDLYQGSLCITTPVPQTDPTALKRVESFWQDLGMRTTRLDPDDHDRLLADVSHLPHALAAALVTMQSDQAITLAGRGFSDTTRIAAGDSGLWRDIFLDNADNVRNAIGRLRLQLDRLESILDPSHAEQLRQWLDAAAQKRRARVDSAAPGESPLLGKWAFPCTK
jgi:prephenate dehydrogenase